MSRGGRGPATASPSYVESYVIICLGGGEGTGDGVALVLGEAAP